MKDEEQQLLYCLTAYRLGHRSAKQVDDFCVLDWPRFYRLAAIHKLGAVVCETLWGIPGFCGNNSQIAARWQKETILQAASQAAKTQRLLHLTETFEQSGISYAVVKGVLCRELYTRPDLRPSSDEDILISPEAFPQCCILLEQNGMLRTDREDGSVTHWLDVQTGLHIELHTALFSSMRISDSLLNDCFSQQLDRTVYMPVYGGAVRTFEPTYHLLFLVCHAIQHFIAGGFGIRTLCDIVTFAEHFQEQIDKSTLYAWLDRVKGRVIFDQVLAIGQHDLAMRPEGWGLSIPTDPSLMLEDILAAGVYGQSSMSRRHSGALVLRAVEEGKTHTNLIRAAFPPRDRLVSRYPILKEKPALLPFIWLCRLSSYGLELIRSNKNDNSLHDSVVLGKQRTEMMIQYGIIPRDKTEDRQ